MVWVEYKCVANNEILNLFSYKMILLGGNRWLRRLVQLHYHNMFDGELMRQFG